MKFIVKRSFCTEDDEMINTNPCKANPKVIEMDEKEASPYVEKGFLVKVKKRK